MVLKSINQEKRHKTFQKRGGGIAGKNHGKIRKDVVEINKREQPQPTIVGEEKKRESGHGMRPRRDTGTDRPKRYKKKGQKKRRRRRKRNVGDAH